MPSHFSTIGLNVTSEEEYLELARTVGPQSEAIEVANGFYYHWQDASGAELWLQVSKDNELLGMNPHFAGLSQMKVRITNTVNRPDDTPLDGAIHGWADPSADEPDSGFYPFVFDLPNYGKYATLKFPSIVTAQVSAFAHEITLYDTVANYNNVPSEGGKFASQSFIPSGLFSPSEGSIEPPQAYAILTGHIIQVEEKINNLTGNKFFWSLIESLGGKFDVVIDPVLVSEMPKVGGVLSGSFWLSGTL